MNPWDMAELMEQMKQRLSTLEAAIEEAHDKHCDCCDFINLPAIIDPRCLSWRDKVRKRDGK